MPDNKEVTPQRNEWEVVTLTASTYAAPPGAAKVEVDDSGHPISENEAELSHALFMSHHFVFPPSEHENLPLEPDTPGILNKNESNSMASNLFANDATSSGKDEEDWTFNGMTIHNEFPGILLFDERGNRLTVSPSELVEGTAIKANDHEEHSAHGSSTFSSFHAETTFSGSATPVAGTSFTDITESCDQGLNLPNIFSETLSPEKSYIGERSGLPCEAWWKRRAVSFYSHAKETNSFWSLFIAATVTGLVILGQHWQQERWQTLQLKWQSSINSGNAGWLLGPLNRLKDVIVGGRHRLV